MLSSAFTVWQPDSSGDMQGRFLINVIGNSQHWEKGSIKTETIPSFYIKGGYR